MAFLAPVIGIVAGGLGLGTFGTAILGTVLSFGLSFAANALMKPKQRSAASSTAPDNTIDRKDSVKQPTAPRQVIYGQTRVGGVYGMISVTQGNQILVGTLMFAGHQCAEIGDLWMADKVLTGLAEVPIGDGEIMLQATTQQGLLAAAFVKHLGTPDQAVDKLVQSQVPIEWTVDHRLRGITYMGFYLYWDNTTGTGLPENGDFQILNLGAKLWTTGLPNFTAIIKGKVVYDPRDDTTEWSENPALCVADYLTDKIYGRGVDYATGIDEAALIAAANACDEVVTLSEGGTEKRYTINGSFLTDISPDEALGKLLASMHGKAIYDGERWIIQAGVYQAPTQTALTDDEMRAPSKLDTLTTAADSFNMVKGTYIGPKNNWQPADFPAVKSAAFKEADGGDELVKDIELPFTTTPSMAQRIAKIDLLRARQEIVETYSGKLSCWRFTAGSTILRTSARYGWVDKPFEVENRTLTFEDDNGVPVVGVTLALREISDDVFDWLTNEESPVDPAPNTNYPDVLNVKAVANLTASEGLALSRYGAAVQAFFKLDWSPSADAFVRTGGYYRIKFKLVADTLWTLMPDTTFVSAIRENVTAGDYVATVEAVNWAGNASPAATVLFTVIGLAAPPSAPTGFTVAAHDTIAYARWTPTLDLDVKVAGHYVLKHSPAVDGSATWANALSMGEDIPGATNSIVVPLMRGTYLIKARDSSGVYSDDAASFIQFQNSVHTFELLAGGSTVQDPTFAGAKTGCVVDDGMLRLDSLTGFDAVIDVDALVDWDGLNHIAAQGFYDYDSVMDLGAVKKVRLTNTVEATIENVLDDFDLRTVACDTWGSWDGSVFGSEADSWLMVEATSDDPAGAPVWSTPQRLHSSTFEARAFRFQRVLESYDSSFSPIIVSDSVVAEGLA